MEEETVGLEAGIEAGLEAGTAGEETLEAERTAGAAATGAAATGAAAAGAAATGAHEPERSGAALARRVCTGTCGPRSCEICAALALGAEAEAVVEAEAEQLERAVEMASEIPSLVSEIVELRREAAARALEVAELRQQLLQQQGLAVEVAELQQQLLRQQQQQHQLELELRREVAGLQQLLLDQEAEAAAMQVASKLVSWYFSNLVRKLGPRPRRCR